MEIVKHKKIDEKLIEVEFSDGTRAQYNVDALVEGPLAPQAFTAQVKDLYKKDTGAGKDRKR